jgi:hypothetical protein
LAFLGLFSVIDSLENGAVQLFGQASADMVMQRCDTHG